MFKAIKALFKSIISLLNIFTGLINLGGDAMADVSREYSDWSTRRQATKAQLADFYANFDTIEELTDKLSDIQQSDMPDALKAQLTAEINAKLQEHITAPVEETENNDQPE